MAGVKRHDGHDHSGSHYANIKYGYIILGLSLVWLVLLTGLSATKRHRKRIPKLVGAMVVTGLVTAIMLLNATDSWKHFAKRQGRVAYSTFPLILFLSLRPSPLPSTYYVKLLFIHKWVSRGAAVIATIHGVTYLGVYIAQGEFGAKVVHKWQNSIGLAILAGMLLMVVTSLRPIRKRNYRLFHYTHYAFAWLTVLMTIVHARPDVNFIAFWCVFILLGQLCYRAFTSHPSTMTVTNISPSLYVITLPRAALPDYFTVGSHVRLYSGSRWSPLTWIKNTHPYTIASLAEEDEIKLVARSVRPIRPGPVQVMGPFSSDTSAALDANSVLIITGGSGISSAAPLAKRLALADIPWHLVWVVRHQSDLNALSYLEIPGKPEVYVTGTDKEADASAFALGGEEDDDDEQFPLTENTPDPDDPEAVVEAQELGKQVIYGRPKFSSIANGFFDKQVANSAKYWVVAAGPKSLVGDVEKWAQRRGFSFTGEGYGF